MFPALRWDVKRGFDQHDADIERALRRGVGGFIVFGGEAEAVHELTTTTQTRCDYPLLFGSDLERGAGQQFRGATQLPPLAAIGSLDSLDVTTRAARLTAREAQGVGINWIFAPDSDVDLEPRNPIVGTRSFGASPALVARHVAAWTRGCHSEGVLACAKHFPGHGRTTEDSHAVLPRVPADRRALEQDLEPFRAAIDAGIDAIMTAHIVFESLDDTTAATLSHAIINDILRRELRFNGLVVTDGMGMQGILDACDGDEATAGIAALNAGCDVLLYPTHFESVADALDAEIRRSLPERRVTDSVERVRAAAERAITSATGHWGETPDRAWSLDVAVQTVQSLRDTIGLPREFDLVTVDDDIGGPFPSPSRDPFTDELREQGFEPRAADCAHDDRAAVVAVYADIRAWKGAPGISAAAIARIQAAVTVRSDAVILLFAHPRLAEPLPGRQLVAAWGGEAIMQQAAARWLAHASGR